MSREPSRRDARRMVRVALIKVIPEKFAVEKNRDALKGVVRASADAQAAVFISPEGFLDGYCTTEESCGREAWGQAWAGPWRRGLPGACFDEAPPRVQPSGP